MPRTPDDPTQAQAWLTQNGPQVELELYVPRGNKGDPGGITLGTLLGTANLNDIVTSGVYRQTSASNSTPLNNYPEASLGVLVVYEVTAGTHLEQEFRPFWFSPTVRHAQVSYRRQFVNGVWSAWRAFPAVRVDETAGRVIYQWDPVNQRDQLITGDTGWRTVTPTPNATVVSGTVRYRRVDRQVWLRFVDLQLSSGATGFGELISAPDVPVGFRPNSAERTFQAVGMTNNAINQQIISCYSAIAYVNTITVSGVTGTRPASPLAGTVSWVTDEVWPTTLPGTAFGSILNG